MAAVTELLLTALYIPIVFFCVRVVCVYGRSFWPDFVSRPTDDPVRWMRLGIVVGFFSTAVHTAWWGSVRWFGWFGFHDPSKWMADQDWPVLLLRIGLLVAAVCHLEAVWVGRSNIGRLKRTSLTAGALWLLAAVVLYAGTP